MFLVNFMDILNQFNIKYNDIELYNQAFTHTSYANEVKCSSYERLEFLGDAVLELIISEYLYKNTEYEEGKMTKLRSHYVCENALYEYSKDLKISDYIKVGHGEESSGGRYKKVIMADIFESLMGAIYLDLGFATVRKVILKIIVPYIENDSIIFFNDYKSALQEAVQTEKRTINYELINESGPAHNKEFTIQVKIDDIIYGKGVGNSKKDAEQEAAKDALNKLAR